MYLTCRPVPEKAREASRRNAFHGVHLVVAGLEVQVLDEDGRVAAPIAPEQGVAADQVQRARHDVAVGARTLAGHHQQDLLAHRLADAVEELPRQVRLAPLVVCMTNRNRSCQPHMHDRLSELVINVHFIEATLQLGLLSLASFYTAPSFVACLLPDARQLRW